MKVFFIEYKQNSLMFATVWHHNDTDRSQFYHSGRRMFGPIYCKSEEDLEAVVADLLEEGYIEIGQ